MTRPAKIDFRRIELLVLDVDGVLTDGRIVLTPAGDEIKSFHVRDGSGMKYWKRVGRRLAVISGRGSEAVLRRAQELDVDAVRLNAKDKLPALEDVWRQLDCTPGRSAVIADDLPDLPLMRHCAFAAAPADAVREVKSAADYVARLRGGQGCVREVIEMLLKKAGLWKTILARYAPAEKEARR